MYNNEELRRDLWLYVHHKCLAEAFPEYDFQIMEPYKRVFRIAVDVLGLKRADERQLVKYLCLVWLDKSTYKQISADISQTCRARVSEKYFMPFSDFNELLDELITARAKIIVW